MKTKLYLLFFFVFPLFMSACRGDDPIPDPPVDGKRTVLVYMAADNSINPLASFTDGDLEELKAGMASIDNTSDMHLLVYIDTGFPRLIEIENKGVQLIDRSAPGVSVHHDVGAGRLHARGKVEEVKQGKRQGPHDQRNQNPLEPA